MKIAIAFLAVFLLALPCFAGVDNDEAQIKDTSSKKAGRILIDWSELPTPAKDSVIGCRVFTGSDHSATSDPKELDIGSNTKVAVNVKGLNCFFYELSSEIDAEVVSIYQDTTSLLQKLAKLGVPYSGKFSQLLDQLSKVGPEVTPDMRTVQSTEALKFERLINAWSDSLKSLKIKIGEIFADSIPKGIGINSEERLILVRHDSIFVAMLKQVKAVGDSARYAVYLPSCNDECGVRVQDQLLIIEHNEKINQQLMEIVKAYSSCVRKIAKGEAVKVGRKASGSVVSITLSVKNKSDSALKLKRVKKEPAKIKIEMEYYVHPNRNFLLHFGYTYNALPKRDFDIISALSGKDFYAEVKDEKGRQDLSAFISLEFLKGGFKDDYGLSATVGTTLSDIGKTIFLGPSLRIKQNWMLTLGVALDEVPKAEEADAVNDEISDLGKYRKLYSRIKEPRETAFFIGLSYRLH